MDKPIDDIPVCDKSVAIGVPPQVDCAGYTTNRKIFPRCEVNCVNCPYQEHQK